MRRTVTAVILVFLVVSLPYARPFMTPTIDGTISGDGVDWDSDDLAVDDPLGDSFWGLNEIDDLWVTYDELNLYIGIRYQVNNNAMLIVIDAGTGYGATSLNNLDWYPRNFTFPDTLLGEFYIANWNGGALGVRRILDNTETADMTPVCEVANTAKGGLFYEAEVSIPWAWIYLTDPGQVDPGAIIQVVSVIAGGDNWGGCDSGPDNNGIDGGGGPILLDVFHRTYVDGNGDGLPDGGYGVIEGSIAFEDPLDDQSIATVSVYSETNGRLIAETETAPGGGAYSIQKLTDDTYRIEAFATGYARGIISGIVIDGGNTSSGNDFLLTRTGQITGEVVFADGPGNDGIVAAYDALTGDIAGEGAVDIPPTGGPYTLFVPDGDYNVVAQAAGYVPDTVTAVITDNDSVGADTLNLRAVRAQKLVLIDDEGNEIESVNTTVSFPETGIYFYASALIEARDSEDRRVLFDIDGYLDQVNLSALKLNNTTPPRGNVVFYDPADTSAITQIALTDGQGSFLISDDEIEVLRIFTITQDGSVTGRFKAGIRSAEPEYLQIAATRDTITADGEDAVTVRGRLFDISLNPVKIAGIGVTFSLAESSTGSGTFEIPTVLTSADGEVETYMTATGAGNLDVTATAIYLNKELQIIGEGGESYVEVVAVAGDPAGIRLEALSGVMGFGETMPITAQLVDEYGNPVGMSGYSLSFSSVPHEAGSLFPTMASLDENGRAVTEFTASAERAIVEVSATSSPYVPVRPTSFQIDRITTFTDPKFPEPDPDHQCLEQMDLTVVSVANSTDGLLVSVRFSTNWTDGIHIGMIMEQNNDAAGATNDPFGFPISYGHAERPEYALTYKYSADDYADFRKWNGSAWIWWDDVNDAYITEHADGANIRGAWITKGATSVDYKIPFTLFEGSIPSSVRLQVYLMQEARVNEQDVKRSAFDSSPHDSTLNLDFDPTDPNAPWDTTTDPVTLHYYSQDFNIDLFFPPAPLLSEPESDPPSVDAGGIVDFTVRVTDDGGGIGDVLIDLSPIGGSRYQKMRDDGANGDETAGDGVYSHQYLLSPEISSGEYELVMTAKDSLNISRNDTTVALSVTGTVKVIRSFTDEVGDDRGPNLFGREGLYYYYPTNSVFVTGGFDLEEVVIFETTKIVAGEIIPSIAFQVRMGNFPNPADKGTANWNPLYADINIQKIDIMIDAFKGGATKGLPNRQNDFQRWDAWDYAIVMEGWYKAVIPSNNQNTSSAWTNFTMKTDRDIILISNFEENWITGIVSRESLGYPTNEEIQDWDIVVNMTSHDGNSNDTNFGDTRWVNASVSEWQLGGGLDGDRDPNIVDLVVSPGVGKRPGRNQSEMLNYKSAEAVARSKAGLTACVLEATSFEDVGPPVILVPDIENETVRFTALINAPLYFTAEIFDDDEVSSATFAWRPDSSLTGEWESILEMGYAAGDVWSVDLPVDEIVEKVILAPLDSTRNIEFEISASDPSGNIAVSPLYTMEIPPPVSSIAMVGAGLDSGFSVRAPEGTFISIPEGSLPPAMGKLPFALGLSPRYISDFNAPPAPARSINVIRTITLELATDTTFTNTFPVRAFDNLIEISFHYPQYAVGGMDENLLTVYEYNERTQTWILLGGNVNPYGNLIRVMVDHVGTFAIFYNPDLKYSPGEVFSGLVFTPNPFSPNGDGLYEETNISFFLTQEATVTIEIFNVDGERVRILERRISFTADDTRDAVPRRITGLVWDGRDNTGNFVPYGIYVCRFTITYSQAGGDRTIRENAAVAVIK